MKKRTAIGIVSILAVVLAHADTQAPSPPTDAERARWTMSDMRTVATALEAYATDRDSYPTGASFAVVVASIQPTYIRKAPTRDAWGHDFYYTAGPDGRSYTLVSAGADGVAKSETWAAAGALDNFNDDAVLASGAFARTWPYR